ncbi:hypothetical protein COW20_05255, partial [bacterium (Candidatus Blackallbacteria) CG13_big_fil_rev_8_21_14_2_50_49_14]
SGNPATKPRKTSSGNPATKPRKTSSGNLPTKPHSLLDSKIDLKIAKNRKFSDKFHDNMDMKAL